jgi:alkanesulfonate monooxygenase SsuD/methylene tetrahydromethanopterin reductase-like flavin-dependent oxidoreductase (luciferase family)
MSVGRAAVNPKPAGPIPVVFGGAGPAVFRRIAARGDGWLPIGVTGEPLAAGWRQIRDLAEAGGRDPEALELLPMAIVYQTPRAAGADRMPFQGSLEQVIEDLAEAEKAGAHEVIVSLDRGPDGAARFSDRAAELYEAARSAGLLG